MSYYAIAGYDLTEMKTDKFDYWKYNTEDGEEYIAFREKGSYQFFEDARIDLRPGMGGEYLYFGYILAAGNEYKFDTEMFDMTQLEVLSNRMKAELKSFQEDGIIKEGNPPFKIILFENSSCFGGTDEKFMRNHVLSF